MKARQKRLILVGVAVLGVGAAAALAINALQSNISYFFSPSQVLAKEAPADHVFRLGGLVVKNSLRRQDDGLTVHLRRDRHRPDGQGLLHRHTAGPLQGGSGRGHQGALGARMGSSIAEEVLAKHDEYYMPPEVADTLKTAHARGRVKMASRTPAAIRPRQVPPAGPRPVEMTQ